MRETEYLAAWLWHEKRCSVGEISKLLEVDGGEEVERLWAKLNDDLALDRTLKVALQAGIDVFEHYAQKGIKLVFRGSGEYPEQLAAFASKMPILSVCGDVSLLKQRQVAIVGSRDINEEGRNAGELVTGILLGRGFVVTSGGARGVDALAHRAAMRVNAPTIVVTATDVGQAYPDENADIYEYAKAHGAVVSQFPMITEPRRELFPSRNSVMAGLSVATVIVQCREESGALYTADASLQLDRPVLVAATSGFCARSEGGLDLVKRGLAKLVSSSEDFDFLGSGDSENRGIVRDLGLLPLFAEAENEPADKRKPRRERALRKKKPKIVEPTQKTVVIENPFWKQLYDAMSELPMGRDALSSAINCKDIAKITEALIQMELNGFVECIAGRYRKMLA